MPVIIKVKIKKKIKIISHLIMCCFNLECNNEKSVLRNSRKLDGVRSCCR